MVCIRFVIVAITVLILGVNRGLWQFSDIAPYILAGLIGGIPTALFYIFKPSNNASRITEAEFCQTNTDSNVELWEDLCKKKFSKNVWGSHGHIKLFY